ncbi:MAG: hypothetical protein U0X39_15960 [Bacteroidales bacterium]
MHERFKFKTSGELILRAKQLGYELPYSEDLSPLLKPLKTSSFNLQNRFAVQPMEGYDSEPDGSPSSLTVRRYLRYAAGGSALIWFEAVAVRHDGRSNPGQLWLNSNNLDSYKSLIDRMRKEAARIGISPVIVIQLTHSGRYSKPDGNPQPLVPALNKVLDKGNPRVLTDDEFLRLEDDYIKAAGLAMEAGFDAIDVKACHGYLVHEMLSCTARTGSRFCGPEPEKRFSYFLGLIDRIKAEIAGMPVTTRVCIWDGYEGGFGMGPVESVPDYTEPLMLFRELEARQLEMVNITMGSPYYNPHVVRPYDTPLPGVTPPEENPLSGVARMIEGTSLMQESFQSVRMVGSAYTWLREHGPHVAAALVSNNKVAVAGFGRNSFAYPDMPLDIAREGSPNPKKFCITCSGCTRLIKSLRHGGCVIRDREIYGEELKRLIADERKQD